MAVIGRDKTVDLDPNAILAVYRLATVGKVLR
jgi:hypothetical protein